MNKTIQNLKDLGFSENDALVYISLAKLKISTPNPIISNTGLHKSLVYTSLEHLVSRKLVSKFEKKGKMHFSITDPSILVEEFNKKQILAETTVRKLIKTIDSEIQEITIHQGNEEYLTLLTTLIKQLPKGGSKYVIGTGGEEFMEETMRPLWKKYHEVVNKAGISIKMISYKNQKKSFEKETQKEKVYKIKYLTEGIENPAGIHIYPEAGVVLNIIYSDKNKPVTAIKIKDKDLVIGYLNLFTNLWKNN